MADAKVTKLFDEREIAVRVEEIASKAVDRLPRDCLIVGLLVGSFVHQVSALGCPLCAKSGHQFDLEGNGPRRLYVIMGRLHITVDVDAISFTPRARQVLHSVRP
jgi:hypothetical protein